MSEDAHALDEIDIAERHRCSLPRFSGMYHRVRIERAALAQRQHADVFRPALRTNERTRKRRRLTVSTTSRGKRPSVLTLYEVRAIEMSRGCGVAIGHVALHCRLVHAI